MTDEPRPEVQIFNRADLVPHHWHKNQVGATDRFYWFYNVKDVSQWFTAGCVGVLEPGGSEAFHSHIEDVEGPYECWYIVMQGEAELRSEYGDQRIQQFGAAFMPSGSSHQIRNVGTERLWYFTLSSRGGTPLKVDTYNVTCSEDRPGYTEEYARIMEERTKRGLATP